MAETNKFFLWTSRLISLAFLAGATCIVILCIYIAVQSHNRQERREVKAVINNQKESLALGSLEEIKGTGLQLIELFTDEGKGYSSGYNRSIRNILFVGNGMKTGRWLFPKNDYLITHNQLRINESDDKCCNTVAIYYQVIKGDTNADGKLSGEDTAIVALSRNDGTGYKEIITKSDKIIGSSLTEDGKCISILHKQKEDIIYSCFDPASFEKKNEFVVTEISG